MKNKNCHKRYETKAKDPSLRKNEATNRESRDVESGDMARKGHPHKMK